MDRAFLTAARSLLRLLVDPRRYRRAMDGSSARSCSCTATATGWCPVAAARDIARRHPGWRYVELAGVGHVPQLQVPDRVATDIVSWLAETSGLETPA